MFRCKKTIQVLNRFLDSDIFKIEIEIWDHYISKKMQASLFMALSYNG